MEEVHLLPTESQILTVLGPVLSRHLLVVTPVVVFCPDMTTSDLSSLHPNPGEVAAIFTSPLEYFLDPGPGEHASFDMTWLNSAEHRMHRFERCGSCNYILGESSDIPQRTVSSSSAPAAPAAPAEPAVASTEDQQDQAGWPVYGMTAGLLIEVARIAYQRDPNFEIYAPNQVVDLEIVAMWYNKEFGTRSAL